MRDSMMRFGRVKALTAGLLLAGGMAIAGLPLTSSWAIAGEASQEQETRIVEDMEGKQVEVPAEITNLFDGYPVNCGIVSMLGGSDAIQYYLPRLQSPNWAWLREVDPTIAGKPTIGEDAMASAEEVLGIDPDVVILSNKDTAATYEQAGIPVFSVSSPTVDDFLTSVLKTGELLGEEEQAKAQEFVDYYRSNIELVQERIADVPEDERPTVYYVGGTTPFDTKIKGNGIEFVTNAGGRFALSPEDLGDGKEVTAEQLLAVDPDVIIVGTNNRPKGYEALMSDDALSGLSALKSGQVYKTPQGTLPWDTFGPEQSMAVLWMAKTLYPDRFEDIDLKAEMTEFYEKFYGYELSDAAAELMLAGVMGPQDGAAGSAAAADGKAAASAGADASAK